MLKERLLILDPEANTQWTLKALLEDEDFLVSTADSIGQALKNFKENEFNSLITEYWIEHSSTLNAVREFKKVFPEAYVMMLSNQEILEKEYEEIISAGIDDFFQKPISFGKVLIHLKKGLKNRMNLLPEKKFPAELNSVVPNQPIQEEAINAKIQTVV